MRFSVTWWSWLVNVQRSTSTPTFQAHNLPSMPFPLPHYGYENTARLCTSPVSRIHEAALLPLPYIIGVLLQHLFSYCLSQPSDNGCRAIPASFSAMFIPSFDSRQTSCQNPHTTPSIPTNPASAQSINHIPYHCPPSLLFGCHVSYLPTDAHRHDQWQCQEHVSWYLTSPIDSEPGSLGFHYLQWTMLTFMWLSKSGWMVLPMRLTWVATNWCKQGVDDATRLERK